MTLPRQEDDVDRADADGGQTPSATRAGAGRGLWPPLLGIGLAAMVLRLLMVFVVHPLCDFDPAVWGGNAAEIQAALQFPDRVTTSCMPLEGDAAYVYLQGRMIADGQGYYDPIRYLSEGTLSPSAWKPPAGPTAVALLATLGLTSPDASRVLGALYGAAAVVLLGALAGRLAGRRAALITAGIAAVFPVFVTNDWKMLAESPFALIVAGALLLAYRLWERPTVGRAVALGALIGAGGYVRYETPALLIFLVLPVVVGFGWLRVTRRVQILATVVLATFIVWAPLLVANQVRFEQRSMVAPGSGWSLKNGTCDRTWYGDSLGSLDFACFDFGTDLLIAATIAERGERPDESVIDALYRDRARTYIDENLPRAPWVMTARALRLWGVWSPGAVVATDADLESRGELDSWAALIGLYVIVPFGVVGTIALRRRRIPISPVVGLVLMTTASAMASFALTRYRLAADVVLVLAAGVGVDAVWRGWQTRAGPFGRLAVLPDDAAAPVRRRAESTARIRYRPPGAVWATFGALVLVGVAVVAWSSQQDPRPERTVPEASCPALDRFAALAEAELSTQSMSQLLAEVATIQAEAVDPSVRSAAEALQRIAVEGARRAQATGGAGTASLSPTDLQATTAAVDVLTSTADRYCPSSA